MTQAARLPEPCLHEGAEPVDVARKFLQMGFTRSRRYANHRSGRKRDEQGRPLPPDPDPIKAQCAAIFKRAWAEVRADPTYQASKGRHIDRRRPPRRRLNTRH